MSSFRSVLDDEVGKAVDESIKINHALQPSVEGNSYFSIAAFLQASLFLAALCLLAIGLLWFQQDVSKTEMQDRLASKTILIEKSDSRPIADPAFDLPVPDVDITMDAPFSVVEKKGIDIETLDAPPTDEDVTIIPTNARSVEEPVVNTIQNGELAAAPIPDLFESTAEGIIPKARLSDGLTPFNAYKKPFMPTTNKPKISFVAINVGMSRDITEQIIEDLPDQISIAFSPYAPDVKSFSEKARTDGHETWLMLPMENRNYPINDPGPTSLLLNASIEQNQMRLLQTMGRAIGYVGMVTWPDHIYKPEDAETSPVVQQVFGRGLAVLDSATASGRDFGKQTAYSNEFPYAKNNFWLDNDLSDKGLADQLSRITDFAGANGSAIVLFKPYPKSIEALSKWLDSSAAKSYEMVPASYLAEYRDQ